MADATPVAHGDFWGDLERRVHVEWLAVTILMLIITAVLCLYSTQIGFARLNHTFYDRTFSLTTRPKPDTRIVIIAIDDSSIEDIGYWPWRRATHARLLDRLKDARVVAFDVLFNDKNPAYPDDDRVLAQAIRQHGRVVLPEMIASDNRRLMTPLPALAQASAALGYINIYPDDDGVVRSLTALHPLPDGEAAPHLLLSMLKVAHTPAQLTAAGKAGGPLFIPYQKTESFPVYPYSKVLDGEVPASVFKDKYVLIGSWGSGLGDSFPTPASSGQPMAGVEILANGLQSMISGHWIRMPAPWQAVVLACLPVLLACLAFRRLSPRRSFMAAAAMFLLVFVGSVLLMQFASLWRPITASLIGVALAFPVWSWRSQEASLRHIDRELKALNRERAALGETVSTSAPNRRDGSLPARITQLHSALAQLRQARSNREETLRFLSHDMRSPQNSILALTQLQQNPESALGQQELLHRIDSYANKTLSLVDGFVQLARAEAMQIQFRPQDLVELLEQSIDELWVRARQHNIDLVAQDLPESAWTMGDALLLRRALGNLIDNAIKYSPDHSRITCRIAAVESSWRIDIQDQGRGISAAQIHTLFQPFTRVSEDQPGNPDGAGLGLAFVHTVAGRHHGRIQVDSAEGTGTTFSLLLPAA